MFKPFSWTCQDRFHIILSPFSNLVSSLFQVKKEKESPCQIHFQVNFESLSRGTQKRDSKWTCRDSVHNHSILSKYNSLKKNIPVESVRAQSLKRIRFEKNARRSDICSVEIPWSFSHLEI